MDKISSAKKKKVNPLNMMGWKLPKVSRGAPLDVLPNVGREMILQNVMPPKTSGVQSGS